MTCENCKNQTAGMRSFCQPKDQSPNYLTDIYKKLSSYEKRLDELENKRFEDFRDGIEEGRAIEKPENPQKEQPKDEVTRVKIGDTLYPGKKYEVLVDIPEQPKETDWFEQALIAEAMDDYLMCARNHGSLEEHRKHFEKLKKFIKKLLKSQESSTREEIGKEFKKWFFARDEDIASYEVIEDAIFRITGIKI